MGQITPAKIQTNNAKTGQFSEENSYLCTFSQQGRIPFTMKRIYFLLLLLICSPIYAGVPIVQPDLRQKTLVAPAYFGPNAFQVPAMNDGTVYDHFHIELSGDYFTGRMVPGALDRATDLNIECHIPLFSNRANLTIWCVTKQS